MWPVTQWYYSDENMKLELKADVLKHLKIILPDRKAWTIDIMFSMSTLFYPHSYLSGLGNETAVNYN